MGIRREMGIMIWRFGGKSGLGRYCGNRVEESVVGGVRPILYPSGVYPVNGNIFAQLYVF